MSDHARWKVVFAFQYYDGDAYLSGLFGASGAYHHIEYVRPDAKDCLRPASASFALHRVPPFVLWLAANKAASLRAVSVVERANLLTRITKRAAVRLFVQPSAKVYLLSLVIH